MPSKIRLRTPRKGARVSSGDTTTDKGFSCSAGAEFAAWLEVLTGDAAVAPDEGMFGRLTSSRVTRPWAPEGVIVRRSSPSSRAIASTVTTTKSHRSTPSGSAAATSPPTSAPTKAGPASKSYGIQVARLAGMPAAVLNQARHTLDALELQATAAQAQVDLFAAPPAAETIAASALDLRLAALNPDAMSPRDALEALYQLKALASAAPLG